MQIIICQRNHSLKIYIFLVIGQISDFNNVILSGQSKNNIIKSQRVLYQQNRNLMWINIY